MTGSRIYIVRSTNGASQRLVEATSQAQAVRHCVSQDYEVYVATTKDVAKFMACGVLVETAGNGVVENPHVTTAP